MRNAIDETINVFTRVRTLPYLPEIQLHLASEVYPLWKHTQEVTGHEHDLPFWAFAWSGGLGLARYILNHPETLHDRNVLDLGSGSGLVAIAAALSGARQITAADSDDFAVRVIERNAQLNRVKVSVRHRDALETLPEADVLLAGDLFYEREMAARLQRLLMSTSASGMSVLVGDPGRLHFPKEPFETIATLRVPVMSAVEEGGEKVVSICRLKQE